MRPVVSFGVTDPSNSNVTILVSVISVSFVGPFVMMVSSRNDADIVEVEGTLLVALGWGETIVGAGFSVRSFGAN